MKKRGDKRWDMGGVWSRERYEDKGGRSKGV